MVQIEFEMNEQEDNNQKKPEEKDGMLFWRTRLKSSRYILAPMVDHSELSFRMLVRQLGVQCTYTPMFNAKVFVRNAKYRDYCLQISEELDRPYIIQVNIYLTTSLPSNILILISFAPAIPRILPNQQRWWRICAMVWI